MPLEARAGWPICARGCGIESSRIRQANRDLTLCRLLKSSWSLLRHCSSLSRASDFGAGHTIQFRRLSGRVTALTSQRSPGGFSGCAGTSPRSWICDLVPYASTENGWHQQGKSLAGCLTFGGVVRRIQLAQNTKQGSTSPDNRLSKELPLQFFKSHRLFRRFGLPVWCHAT